MRGGSKYLKKAKVKVAATHCKALDDGELVPHEVDAVGLDLEDAGSLRLGRDAKGQQARDYQGSQSLTSTGIARTTRSRGEAQMAKLHARVSNATRVELDAPRGEEVRQERRSTKPKWPLYAAVALVYPESRRLESLGRVPTDVFSVKIRHLRSKKFEGSREAEEFLKSAAQPGWAPDNPI
ncbi:hypothetical protein DL764_005460 [Monosporascus ibericus]|uniref:Uncharacterized protein n=1 Tax=Monosporascus ibericus TaxID=155417 RepID=A0A4Q4TBP9_9PEZI|nr:hypothetical protein DL764_005460 [Monosporascus ibericus]